MNRLKFYRRIRGGVWVKYYDKREATRTYWVRYKTVEEAYTIGAFMHDPICFEVYGELTYKDIQSTIYVTKQVDKKSNIDDLSDGYHTFNELYAHRTCLFTSLLNIFHKSKMYTVWKSKKSQEGHAQGDWFIAGMDTKEKQGYITYHLPMSMWDHVQAPEIDKARWDGHTSPIVLFRLMGIEQIGSYRIEHVDNVSHRKFHFWDGTIVMRKKGKIKLPEWVDKYLCFTGGTINKFDEIEMGKLTMFEHGEKIELHFDDKEIQEGMDRRDWEQVT